MSQLTGELIQRILIHTHTHTYILTLRIPIYSYLVVIQNGAQVVSGFPRKSNVGTNQIFVSIFSHNSITPCSPFSTPGMRSAGPRFFGNSSYGRSKDSNERIHNSFLLPFVTSCLILALSTMILLVILFFYFDHYVLLFSLFFLV